VQTFVQTCENLQRLRKIICNKDGLDEMKNVNALQYFCIVDRFDFKHFTAFLMIKPIPSMSFFYPTGDSAKHGSLHEYCRYVEVRPTKIYRVNLRAV